MLPGPAVHQVVACVFDNVALKQTWQPNNKNWASEILCMCLLQKTTAYRDTIHLQAFIFKCWQTVKDNCENMVSVQQLQKPSGNFVKSNTAFL